RSPSGASVTQAARATWASVRLMWTSASLQGTRSGRSVARPRLSVHRVVGEDKPENRTMRLGAAVFETAAVGDGDPPRNGEADPRSVSLGGEERNERRLFIPGGQSGPVVPDSDHHLVRLQFTGEADLRFLAFTHSFGGVLQQVDERLFQQVRVSVELQLGIRDATLVGRALGLDPWTEQAVD